MKLTREKKGRKKSNFCSTANSTKSNKTEGKNFSNFGNENENESRQLRESDAYFDGDGDALSTRMEFNKDNQTGTCEQCTLPFNSKTRSPIQEACGHITCRSCFIQNLSIDLNYCHQCDCNSEAEPEVEAVQEPQKESLQVVSPGLIRTGVRSDLRRPNKNLTLVASKISNRYRKNRRSKDPSIPNCITITPIKSDSGVGQVLYKCNPCMKTFKSKCHVAYHKYCQKSDTAKPFQCEECGRGFVAKSHYEYHLRTHTGEKPYACTVCDKRFIQKSKVNRHMKSFHTKSVVKFKCQYCGKTFTAMASLKRHVKTHFDPPKCKIAKKSFNTDWGLNIDGKTHQCSYCARSFENLNSEDSKEREKRRRHLMTHLPHRPFKCKVCGTGFRRQDHLYGHSVNLHGVYLERYKEKVKIIKATKKSKIIIPKSTPKPRVTLQLGDGKGKSSLHDYSSDSENYENENDSDNTNNKI